MTAEELDARVERALSARTQGELAALVADLSAATATATKDVLVVEQTGGKWTRAGRWTVPGRIEVRTKLCRVTFDFTDAVITSRTVRIDTDMQHGKLVIVGAPGIVIDADGLNLVFSKTKLRSDSAAADPGLRIELVGTLKHAKVVERRPCSLSWSKTRFWHDCIYGTWQMIFVIDQSVSRAPRQGSCCRKVVCRAGFNVQTQVICTGHAMQAERTARRADSAGTVDI